MTANIVWGAISDVTKTDINFKVNQTKQFSTTDKQFYEEAGNKLPQSDWNQIWATTLTDVRADMVTSGDVTCTTTMELTEDVSVTGNRSWTATYEGTVQRQWVPPFYGAEYLAKIYKDDGSGGVGDQIAPADVSDWFFDYGEGRWSAQDAITYAEPLHIDGCWFTGNLLSDVVSATSTQQFTFTVYDDGTWDNEAVPIWISPKDYAVEIIQVHAATMGTNPVLTYNIEERAKAGLANAGTDIYAADQDADADGEDETAFSNGSIAAGSHLVFTTDASSESGTVTLITGVVYYRE